MQSMHLSFFLVVATLLCPQWMPAMGEERLLRDSAVLWQCQWKTMNKQVLSRFRFMKDMALASFRDLANEHRDYIASLAGDESVRNHENLRRARSEAESAVSMAYASRLRLNKAMSLAHNALNFWEKHFQYNHPMRHTRCEHAETLFELDKTIGFSQQVDTLATELESLLSLSAQHVQDFNKQYGKKLQRLVQGLKEEESFFALKEKAVESFRSAIRVQKSLTSLVHHLEDRMETGCEVERKLSVVKEIFLALKHVAADVINREEMLLERLAALKSTGLQSDATAAIVNAQTAIHVTEGALKDADAAYKNIMASIRGDHHESFHKELGQNGEFEVGGEKCVEDIKEEQTLLREALVRGMFNFHGFVDWKPAVESLWNKVKHVDNAVRPSCHQWKGVKCDELSRHIRSIVENCDQVRASVEDKLTNAIRSLMSLEKAAHAAEERVADDKAWVGESSHAPEKEGSHTKGSESEEVTEEIEDATEETSEYVSEESDTEPGKDIDDSAVHTGDDAEEESPVEVSLEEDDEKVRQETSDESELQSEAFVSDEAEEEASEEKSKEAIKDTGKAPNTVSPDESGDEEEMRDEEYKEATQ
ncbi:hypothetical protein, conserved in T. vivax [Trypanosoma vivax Y486]|uniref:Uncharacterized protein n=1 Tax=Trypanosoma vivax (strain Y486) TaxID=1055687 RepID=F9WSB3_TRYVY|nr:hypothetical protein, conserved in T. vivax [Trypanosoma vivax Y486]|eukprot:CCD20452.1 hypothetical protein, conserved in T. vivax [Trypanosoma vivax Y486]